MKKYKNCLNILKASGRLEEEYFRLFRVEKFSESEIHCLQNGKNNKKDSGKPYMVFLFEKRSG